jgi:hypothetical protein
MSIFTNYSIQVDCLITWFPVRSSARLKEPRIRMDTFRYKADDQPFASGGKQGRFHGQALGGIDDGLTSTNLVRAITETGVDKDQVFFIEFEIGIGHSVRNQRLMLQSGTITPFLFNLRAAQADDQEVIDTAVAFQGVVTATSRRSELVYDVIRPFLSFFPRREP